MRWRPVLTYNAARLGLFAAMAGLLYLVGFRSYLLLLGALVLSGVLSWFLLGRQRVAMGEAVAAAVDRYRGRYAQRVAAEDAAADELAGRQGEVSSPPR